MENQESSSAGSSPSAPSKFDFANHQFVIPAKKIDDPATLEQFKKSEGCGEILSFLAALTQAVQNTRMTETPLTEVK